MTSEVQETTREAVLSLLLKNGESSASKLASCLGVSVQAMRRHLRSLQDVGLVKASQSSKGPGRPSNLWELTVQGRTRFNSFNSGSQDFALDLLSAVETNFPKDKLANLFAKQTITKANLYNKKIGPGSINTRLAKFVELRNQEGYLAELHPQPDNSGWYLNAFHCSISSIAEQYPFVCDQELQLINHIFPDCEVKRVQWRLDAGHSCGFYIAPIQADG